MWNIVLIIDPLTVLLRDMSSLSAMYKHHSVFASHIPQIDIHYYRVPFSISLLIGREIYTQLYTTMPSTYKPTKLGDFSSRCQCRSVPASSFPKCLGHCVVCGCTETQRCMNVRQRGQPVANVECMVTRRATFCVLRPFK